MDWVLLGHLKPENHGNTLQTVWDVLRIVLEKPIGIAVSLDSWKSQMSRKEYVPPPVINGLIIICYNPMKTIDMSSTKTIGVIP